MALLADDVDCGAARGVDYYFITIITRYFHRFLSPFAQDILQSKAVNTKNTSSVDMRFSPVYRPRPFR
jgi:hypothetical protein